jgi:tripartite-type tricarboxylate transporter receptor subunit TctC
MRTYDVVHLRFRMSMRRIPSSVLALATVILSSSCGERPGKPVPSFPAKPIKIVVYTAPGGLIDITARKFTEIATRYTDAVFVVENKPGAGGIVAMQKVLQMPADGYTLLACTKSNIAKLVSTGNEDYIPKFHWLAMLMADPECVITRQSNPVNTWGQVVADARERPGQQIWVGPAVGGLDHVTALKLWEKHGIRAKWIPFKSGGQAKAALLGNQGVAYVGNPRDAEGNPDLKVAVVSSARRLPQLPDTPTFNELGAEGLDSEIMWRGFTVRNGTPETALSWYGRLFAKVTSDPEWRAYWEKGGIDVVHRGPEEFAEAIERDRQEFTHYLKKLGLIK